MPRPKGIAKTGGRQKGTPNKRTLVLADCLTDLNFDILERITDLIPILDVNKQADVLLELMTYLYPKRKAVSNEFETNSASSKIQNNLLIQKVVLSPDLMKAVENIESELSKEIHNELK
ncbi:MAG: hypothetical protein H6623_02675 [Bdellovibrionaceae bacterium]|nr:hypothetical protein [Pseudobdellovibrionaceae bacterium]